MASSSDAALFDHLARWPRWFSSAALEPVREINRRMLTVMAAQPPVMTVPDEIAEHLRILPVGTLERIARSPCLLVTAGFDDAARWNGAKELAAELRSTDAAATATKGVVVRLARETLFVAWYYARTYAEAAGLVIGASTATVQSLRELTLDDLEQLAVAHSDWIQLRWIHRPNAWRRLLEAGQTNTASCTAELRALQFVLSESIPRSAA